VVLVLVGVVWSDSRDWFDKEVPPPSNVTLSVNWMKYVPGGKRLNGMSIPGSHGSYAIMVSADIRTFQVLSIPQQLNLGIRFFDIGLSRQTVGEITGLFCSQGGNLLEPPLFVDDLVNQFINFLDANPSETVILYLHNEKSDAFAFEIGIEALFLNTVIESYFYTNNVQNISSVPTLDEVRGKIVLFNGIGLRDFWRFGLEWPVENSTGLSQNAIFSVENFKEGILPNEKLALVDSNINTNANLWKVTLLSSIPTEGCIGTTNDSCIQNGDFAALSEYLNHFIYNFIPTHKNQELGILSMDFPGQYLINLIIQRNIYNPEDYLLPPPYDYKMPRWVVGAIGGVVGLLVLVVLFVIYLKTDYANPEEEVVHVPINDDGYFSLDEEDKVTSN